jgi:hypothetical protein
MSQSFGSGLLHGDRGWKPAEDVLRTSYEIAANRYLLIGCAGLITLIVTLLVAALR